MKNSCEISLLLMTMANSNSRMQKRRRWMIKASKLSTGMKLTRTSQKGIGLEKTKAMTKTVSFT